MLRNNSELLLRPFLGGGNVLRVELESCYDCCFVKTTSRQLYQCFRVLTFVSLRTQCPLRRCRGCRLVVEMVEDPACTNTYVEKRNRILFVCLIIYISFDHQWKLILIPFYYLFLSFPFFESYMVCPQSPPVEYTPRIKVGKGK